MDKPSSRLPFLKTDPGFARNSQLRVCEEGGFSVRLPEEGWTVRPSVAREEGGTRFTWLGQGGMQWLSVLHRTRGDWTDISVYIPVEDSFDTIWESVPESADDGFVAMCGAEEMASWTGSVEFSGRVCRVFVVVLRRGTESWAVEYGFPAFSFDGGPAGAEIDESDSATAGLVLGTFRCSACACENISIGDKSANPEENRGIVESYHPCWFCGRIVAKKEVYVAEMKSGEKEEREGLLIKRSWKIANVKVPCCRSCMRSIYDVADKKRMTAWKSILLMGLIACGAFASLYMFGVSVSCPLYDIVSYGVIGSIVLFIVALYVWWRKSAPYENRLWRFPPIHVMGLMGYALIRPDKYAKTRNIAAILFAVALMAIGVKQYDRALDEVNECKRYKRTSAKVCSVQEITVRTRRRTTTTYVVEYSFLAGRQRYIGKCENNYKPSLDAITVYYDPLEPSKSKTKLKESADVNLLIMLGLFTIAGVISFLSIKMIIAKIRNKRRELSIADGLDEPPEDYFTEEEILHIRQQAFAEIQSMA